MPSPYPSKAGPSPLNENGLSTAPVGGPGLNLQTSDPGFKDGPDRGARRRQRSELIGFPGAVPRSLGALTYPIMRFFSTRLMTIS